MCHIQNLPSLGLCNISFYLSGHVMGKVTFHQKEGSATYLRESGELAANIPTMVSFELADHQRNLRTARFTYTWDLGNGDVIVGPEPVMHYRYASSGNYTFKLNVGVNINRVVRLTGLYSMDLTVLDAITSIELRGPLSYSVNQSSSLSFLISGSLPAWVCWRVLPNCRSVSRVSCKLVRLYERQFKLNYTFKSLGTHCLDLSAQNDISELQASYSVYVQKNMLSLLIFILPCASLITAAVIFIAISVCRPPQPSLLSKKGETTTYLSFADTEAQRKGADNPDGLPSLIISEPKESEALPHTS
ncbi:transmembrane protein 130 isoform X2 [Salminus brasiliensis]|uniref:transmembrane protein 130 isoform X2 n=1 Tax=Salminus brasiliensis TaxID=930266 RepID=UPI003B8310B7